MLRGEAPAQALDDAIRRYEALEDLLGRIISYAGLRLCRRHHRPEAREVLRRRAGAPDRGLAATSCSSSSSSTASTTPSSTRAAATAPLPHYRPWLEDIRKEKPYQLDDKIEQLFHEKSVTGRAAWNRLFDETMASLRSTCDGEELTLEPTLNKLQDSDGEVRAAPPRGARPRRSSANLRVFTLITNTLAKDKEIADRWRDFEDVADSRHLANRVEREVVDALVAAVREAYPRLSHRYYALKAKWFGVDSSNHWDRNAPLPKVEQRTIPWDDARDTVLDAYARLLAAHGRHRPALLRRALDRRAGAARQGAGRLRAPDRAVGPPLRAAQLPGQAARRDDAGARARPRRPPGAGRAATAR